MDSVMLSSETESEFTLVSDIFIDKYMAYANGEFVKSYLYLLRCLKDKSNILSLSVMADVLNYTESDIIRAVKYWEKQGVLSVDISNDNKLKGLKFLNLKTGNVKENALKSEQAGRASLKLEKESASKLSQVKKDKLNTESEEALKLEKIEEYILKLEQAEEDKSKINQTKEDVSVQEQSKKYKPNQSLPEEPVMPTQTIMLNPLKEERKTRNPHEVKNIEKLKDDEDFKQLMYIIQKYLGITLKPNECDIFAYLYNELKFSIELLEHLVEYCVSAGHKHIRYIESVALDWHGKGIMTIDRAKAYTSSYSKEYFEIMKAFGVSDRRPATYEKNMIDRWFFEYAFSIGIVLEACHRTIAKIHQPSFEYADSILKSWKSLGVHSKNDIIELDILHKSSIKKQEDKNSANTQKTAPKSAASKFHNFTEHSYDYDEILKKIQ
jgi:DnaD and phage-associated domain